MTDSRVAKRYASALFNTALQEDILQSVEDDLTGICNVLAQSDELRRFMSNPNATRDEKLRLLVRTFSDRVTALTMHALRLLLKRRREHCIQQVRLEYVNLRREYEKVSYMQVASATELDTAQRQAIVSKIESVTGRRVETEFVVDPSLIGGVRATFDNYVLDGSAKGYLERMKDKILYDLLKQA